MSFAQLPLAASPPATSPPAPAPFSFDDTPRLTRALRAGDEEAFRFLHAEWNQRLARYCFSLAECDAAIAHEIVQNTYLRIFRHVRELPSERIFWNWIICAARSAAIDLRRTGGRYRNALARFAQWFRAERIDEVSASEESMLGVALDHALASLSPDELALIEARYVAERSLAETGNDLGTSARAIEGRLARIRSKLREQIAIELIRQRGGE